MQVLSQQVKFVAKMTSFLKTDQLVFSQKGFICEFGCIGLIIGVERSSKQIIIMTQNHLKILSGIFLTAACLSLFDLTSLILIAIAFFFTYKYLKALYVRYSSKGIIQMLPQSIQQKLLHRSIFDMVCDFWFYDSFVFLKRLLKLLCKPLIEPIQPDNAIEALNDMESPMKRSYLVKGVVRVMPQTLQTIILGKQKAQLQRLKLMQEEKQNTQKLIKCNDSDRNTDDKSESNEIMKLKLDEQRPLKTRFEFQQEKAYIRKQHQQEKLLLKRDVSVSEHKPLRRSKPQNLIENIQHSIKMLKRLLQMQNISEHIHRTSTASIIKVMAVFWLALILQMKYNKNSRKIVIKTLYVLGGIVTVLGTVGTTSVLIIKHCKTRKNSGNRSEIQP